jgi:hypothetical protein
MIQTSGSEKRTLEKVAMATEGGNSPSLQRDVK